MKSEDGTGGRHPSWRCGNVTPPISFKIQEDNLMLSSFYFLPYSIYDTSKLKMI